MKDWLKWLFLNGEYPRNKTSDKEFSHVCTYFKVKKIGFYGLCGFKFLYFKTQYDESELMYFKAQYDVSDPDLLPIPIDAIRITKEEYEANRFN
mgnify:CR=1 FL=1